MRQGLLLTTDLLKKLVRENGELERLVVRDREEEGMVVMVVMERECRESYGQEGEAAVEGGVGNEVWWTKNRTTVPAMRMRHLSRLELSVISSSLTSNLSSSVFPC